MANSKVVFIIFSIPLLLLDSTTSFAQPVWLKSSAEMMPQAFLKHEDTNGDGKVTASEFQGPKSDFIFFDKNGDGIIELSEAPAPDDLPKSLKMGQTANTMKNSGASNSTAGDIVKNPMSKVILNGIVFNLYKNYDFFTWKELPEDVKFQRMSINEFTGLDGVTHYYETVYVSTGNLNWFQAAYLAQDAGGYLASLSSEEENLFVFNLINDEKFFWKFPKYDGNPNRKNHYEIKIGPFLGGYQPEGSPEPSGGWKWLSGEAWGYANWAVNLDDGVIDKDPRKNTQPNDSGTSPQGQRVMGFGEMNLPVSTWGDYMDDVGTYGEKRTPGRSFGFIIEYESDPKKR